MRAGSVTAWLAAADAQGSQGSLVVAVRRLAGARRRDEAASLLVEHEQLLALLALDDSDTHQVT